MMATPGHKGFSVSEDEAITCVPDSLYMLLKIMFGGQEVLEDSEKDENTVQNRLLSVVIRLRLVLVVQLRALPGRDVPKQLNQSDELLKVVMFHFPKTGQTFSLCQRTKRI